MGVQEEAHREHLAKSKGSYIDINFSYGSHYIIGPTSGVMIDQAGVHPYIGIGLLTPGPSVSVTSGTNVGHGWNVAGQMTLAIPGWPGAAGQVGYNFEGGGWFWEGGLGYSLGGGVIAYYAF